MVRFITKIAVCLALAAMAFGQQGTPTGTLTGTVTGFTGPGNVVLILTNVSTGAAQRITPDSTGAFSVVLAPGTYRVEVEREGFRQTAPQSVTIVAGVAAQLTITIQGGPIIEAVEVNATAPAAQDTPPEVGTGYTSNTVRTLPVFDRNYQELNGLMSGVTPPATTFPLSFDPQLNRQWNTNGLPAFTNDQISDGISIREPYTAELAIRILPDEAIQQLNVITSNYPVSEGFASGTLSNLYPRPGTNGIHGSLFGFVSDDFFKTHDAFNIAPNPEPTLHKRQFGGTAGGALIPDKLFWFTSYQGDIETGEQVQYATVPTAAERLGNFSATNTPIYNPATGLVTGLGRLAFPGGVIPLSQLNPVSLAYLSYLPLPNQPGPGNNLIANVPSIDRSNVVDGRIDYHLSNTTTAFMRYGWSTINANQGSVFGAALAGDTLGTLRNHQVAAGLVGDVHGFITELRIGYTRYRNAIQPANVNPALTTSLAGLGFGTGATVVPNATIEGLGTLGTPTDVPVRNVDNNYEGSATVHWYHGRNQVYFGVDIRNIWSYGFQNFPYSTAGSFLFTPGPTSYPGATINAGTAFTSSMASFLLGAPTTSGIFNSLTIPSYYQNQYSGFIGDMIRMNRLTFDVGFRYEIYSPVTSSGLNGNATYSIVNNTTRFSNSTGNYYYGLGAAQPRLGVAFRLSPQTVIRTAYSINSFPLPYSVLPVNFTGVGTSSGVVGSFLASSFAIPTGAQVTAGTPTANLPYYVNSVTRYPYVQNYYFTVQRSAWSGFLISVGYYGNVARHMPYIQDINVAQPGTGLAGLPFLASGQTAGVYVVGTGQTSNYNSLQVNLNKRLAKGAAFAIAYTYGRAMDHGLYLLNPFSIKANYGPADWDRQQMLTISHIFDLPMGQGTNRWNQGVAAKILGNWKLNGLFHWTTGAPFNVYADSLNCNCPGIANTVAGVPPGAPVSGRDTLNPALFSLPSPGTFGVLGRNAIRGPNFTEYNLSLFKSFPLAENRIVELRAEAYNLLNSTQFGYAYNNVSLPTFGQGSPLLGQNGLFGGQGRIFVLGGRILF